MKWLPVTIMAAVLMTRSMSAAQSSGNISLNDNWSIQSAERITDGGGQISSPEYNAEGWYEASVPSTVLGSLVHDGVFKNVFQGTNLAKIPDSLFNTPWWYRTSFSLPKTKTGADHAILKFLGINYKADIWLNGKLLADSNSVFGAFRQFEYDVSKEVHFGGQNYLAIEIHRPQPGALTIGFVDWSPEPPDHNMGVWRPVEIRLCGDVSISSPFVATEVDTATLKKAALTVSAEVTNLTDRNVDGILTGQIGKVTFNQAVSLLPRQRKTVVFLPDKYNKLVFRNPKLWWTHDFGKPNLYSLRLRFSTVASKISRPAMTDFENIRFGIRQINDYINAAGFRGYKLNGKPILIRGGGWADHMFLDQDRRNVETQIDYALNMHLNAIRMEGFWGTSSDIYRLCDEKGLLIMAGFSCQWEWGSYFGTPDDEYGCIKSPQDMETAAESFKDQVKWLRNHPSIFVWLYGSDKIPRPELEHKFLNVLATYDSTRPRIASAAEHTSTITGPTAVKMRGPYDYVPPVYWYEDSLYGGAFGFNTETGPGAQVPRAGSLRKMLSPDSLWPVNGEWYYHCSRGVFGTLKSYNAAIEGRLGKPVDLTDYERKAQLMNYDGERAMYEAFGARKFVSTGVIQWMYNTAWPKMWWQLYDYYLNPTGAFYGAQEACKPLHVEYDYANHSIVVVNSGLKPSSPLELDVRVVDFDMKSVSHLRKRITAAANSSKSVAEITDADSLTPVYFLDLRLYRGHSMIDENFYALSTTPDKIIENKSTWYQTGSTYANLEDLNKLPAVRIEVRKLVARKGDRYNVTAVLTNPTSHLAFMTYLSITRGKDGTTVLPVFWEDNYISILPGETRTIHGYVYAGDLRGLAPGLRVSGWNVSAAGH
jgi:exo-1,4-beta-D-glucosaminidase